MTDTQLADGNLIMDRIQEDKKMIDTLYKTALLTITIHVDGAKTDEVLKFVHLADYNSVNDYDHLGDTLRFAMIDYYKNRLAVNQAKFEDL